MRRASSMGVPPMFVVKKRSMGETPMQLLSWHKFSTHDSTRVTNPCHGLFRRLDFRLPLLRADRAQGFRRLHLRGRRICREGDPDGAAVPAEHVFVERRGIGGLAVELIDLDAVDAVR